ncbi:MULTISPECIES: hypothetical protein [Halomonadaceae]|uniref:hypothetical protein n=1 Tax=Halomonadaceae TaxID=28256 RepID=UPI0018D20D40|nr:MULTISPECIES: hypothetical protein [Halomonas]QPP51074.1 hypothetical protein I4484_08340 [Halomonas sp. SS10-MC5]
MAPTPTVLTSLEGEDITAGYGDRRVLEDVDFRVAESRLTALLGPNGSIEHSGPPEAVFTAANLKQVFDLDADVIRAPNTGRPVCIPALGSAAALGRLNEELPA